MTKTRAHTSWGRLPSAESDPLRVSWRSELLPDLPEGLTALPYGLGRSYGDSCLNDGGALLLTRGLDRFIAFDRANGVLRCEAGVTLEEIIHLVLPQGWFLPVTPGTKFVTVGGAIANDVHGKNHHRVGTFGRFVRRFELARSDGERLTCSPVENADWFQATIGGLGLTGLVTWAEIQLRPVANAYVETESVKFGSLAEFFDLNAESERDFEYTVAWVDCLATGSKLGRGHYLRGNHAGPQLERLAAPRSLPLPPVPFDLPGFALNSLTVRAFNFVYYHRQRARLKRRLASYDSFFYPLDAVGHWNRIYGRRGFYQYQFVLPPTASRMQLREIFEEIAESGQASFLAVLKTFGDKRSPGWLSFPKPGVTLALDFPNRGEKTLALFERLDRLIADGGGAVYPAKDARMSGEHFRAFFPAWEKLGPYIDPRFSSSFWRRVTGGESALRARETA